MLKKFIVWHIHLFKRHTLPIQGNRDIIWLELKTIMRGLSSCYILPLCCAFHISYVFQSHIVFLRHNQCQFLIFILQRDAIFMHMHLQPRPREFIFAHLTSQFHNSLHSCMYSYKNIKITMQAWVLLNWNKSVYIT